MIFIFGLFLFCLVLLIVAFFRSKSEVLPTIVGTCWVGFPDYLEVSRRLFKELGSQGDLPAAFRTVTKVLGERFSFLDFVILYASRSDRYLYPSSDAQELEKVVSRYLNSIGFWEANQLENVLSGLSKDNFNYVRDDRRPVFIGLPNKGSLLPDSMLGVFLRASDQHCLSGPMQQEFVGFAQYLVENSLAIVDQQRGGAEAEVVSFNSALGPQLCHDLRAPLSNIKAILSLFDQQSADGESFRTLVSIAQTSCNSLKLLVDDLLDYLHGGQVRPPRRDTFCLRRLVHEVCDEYRMLAELKGLQLHAVSLLENASVFADYLHIRRVLCNLVSNAIKYSSVGKIEVRVEAVVDGSVLLSVVDSGSGSEHAESPVPSRDSKIEDSFGLGLLIVRQLLEANGSSLHIKSSCEAGSCFSCSLPMAA